MDKKSSNRFPDSRSDNRKSKIENPKWVGIFAIVLTFAFGGGVVQAQQAARIPRIGYISSSGSAENPDPAFEIFRQKMRELGYVEGKNVFLELRYGKGRLDRMPALVNEFVEQKIDIIVATNNVVIRAAKQATKTIPIVMRSSIDPVAAGYVESLARPGGNITGVTHLGRELSAKRLELLKEVLPRMSRLAILWDPDGPGPSVAFKEYGLAAKTFRLEFHSLEVRAPKPDFETAFRDASKFKNEALIVVSNPLLNRHRKQIVALATKSRLPSLTEHSEWVNAGGLISYASSHSEAQERLAIYVDKILKGAKPADLPVEQPTKFELVINLKTAKQIGLTIPQSVLYRANRVIR